jgi:hypothetical protein
MSFEIQVPNFQTTLSTKLHGFYQIIRFHIPDDHKLYTARREITKSILKIYSIYIYIYLSLCLTNYALAHEGVWGSGYIDPRFLGLGTSWRWVVSFTPLPLYLRGKSPRYPLDRRLGGPQSRYGRRGEEKILDPTGTRTPNPRSSSPWPVAIPTTPSRLLYAYIGAGIAYIRVYVYTYICIVYIRSYVCVYIYACIVWVLADGSLLHFTLQPWATSQKTAFFIVWSCTI